MSQHTRLVLANARQDGPAALYQALRGVMRTGRRYKPPLLLPAIQVSGSMVADPDEVQASLAEHFAEPEHGSPQIGSQRCPLARPAAHAARSCQFERPA